MLQQIAHYRIEELLGEGSFASVYRVFDQKFERYVALKILKPVWLSDTEAVGRFKQEAKTLAKLRHPHIIDVFDVGEADGFVYLAQLLVEGETLITRLKRSHLEWAEILSILQAVAAALDYAHAQRVVHRDVKPSNILLDKNNQPFLGDFGLVRVAERSMALSASSGGVKGTAAYIPPEVWNEEEATPTSDIYALSCVVFEMITGAVLFDGSSMAVMRKHDRGPQFPEKWPAGIPPGVTEVLQRGLAKDPLERFSRASELARVLATLPPGTATKPEPPQVTNSPTLIALPAQETPVSPVTSPVSQLSPRKRWPRGLLAILVGGSLLLGIMACVLLVFIRSISSGFPAPAEIPSDNNTPVFASQPLSISTPKPPTSPLPTTTSNPKVAGTATAKAQVTSTMQARATSIAKVLATEVAEAEIVYKEDFSLNKRGWLEGKDSDDYGDFLDQFIGGKYRRSILLSKEGVITRQNVPDPASSEYFKTKDFLLSVVATVIKISGDAGISITFRENENGDYYNVEFSNNGEYTIDLHQDGKWQTIKDWTRSDAINLKINKTNTFTLLVKGSSFTVFANGQLLTSVEDTSLMEKGEVGLGISVREADQNITVDFDNLIFKRVPGTSPVPTPTARPTPRPTQASSIPVGRGKFVFENKTSYDLIIDIIGPTKIDAALLPPGTEKEFFLEPGHYSFNSHSPGGKIAAQSADFDLNVGEVEDWWCC